jgi:hypothetical protein
MEMETMPKLGVFDRGGRGVLGAVMGGGAGLLAGTIIDTMLGPEDPDASTWENNSSLLLAVATNGAFVGIVRSTTLESQDYTGGVFLHLLLFLAQPHLKQRSKKVVKMLTNRISPYFDNAVTDAMLRMQDKLS